MGYNTSKYDFYKSMLMELPEISEVRNIREKMHLSLRKFAKKCDLSVSWINQVETGVIEDPSYLKMKKIFDMYELEKHGNKITADEICIKDIISFELGSSIEDANKKMIETGISQIPVFHKNVCIGMITDKKITGLVGTDVSGAKIVKDMLEIPPPRIDARTTVRALRQILESYEYVLVEKNGYIHGILVRQDLMKLLSTQ